MSIYQWKDHPDRKLGKKHNIKTPHNEKVYKQIKEKENEFFNKKNIENTTNYPKWRI